MRCVGKSKTWLNAQRYTCEMASPTQTDHISIFGGCDASNVGSVSLRFHVNFDCHGGYALQQ